MNGSSDYIRGFTEYIILSILEKFDSYGYELTRVIETASGQVFQPTEAALYLALKRMTEDNLIVSGLQKNKKGMNRRVYSITPEGMKRLTAFRKEWGKIHQHLQSLVAGEFTYVRDEQ
jgi:DNA-binding PadR family transcriptional regulator